MECRCCTYDCCELEVYVEGVGSSVFRMRGMIGACFILFLGLCFWGGGKKCCGEFVFTCCRCSRVAGCEAAELESLSACVFLFLVSSNFCCSCARRSVCMLVRGAGSICKVSRRDSNSSIFSLIVARRDV